MGYIVMVRIFQVLLVASIIFYIIYGFKFVLFDPKKYRIIKISEGEDTWYEIQQWNLGWDQLRTHDGMQPVYEKFTSYESADQYLKTYIGEHDKLKYRKPKRSQEVMYEIKTKSDDSGDSKRD